MKSGIYKQDLASATENADQVLWFQPSELDWSLADNVASGKASAQVVDNIDLLIEVTLQAAQPGSHIVIMSNGSFGDFHQRLLAALASSPHSLESKA